MGINSNHLNEEGYAMCISCRRKKFVSDLEPCQICGRFVCKSCYKVLRNSSFKYVCKKCVSNLKTPNNG